MQRRQVLRAGVALSLPALAGCNRDAGPSPATDAPPATGTPTTGRPEPAAPASRWRTTLDTPPVDAPMLADGTVVLVTERPGEEPFPERNAHAALLGFDAADGTASWSFAAGDDAAESWRHRDVVLASWHSGTVGLGSDGSDRWRREDGAAIALFAHGNAYLSADGGVVAVDPSTGAERWRMLGAERLVPAAVDDDAVYLRGFANAGDPRRGLHAVASGNGALRWSRPVGPRDNNAVLHADGTLVVGGYPEPVRQRAGETYPDHPTVEGVAAAGGAVRWRVTPDADLALPRRAADGAVLLKTWTFVQPNGGPDVESSTLRALDLADGSERWRVEGTAPRTPLGQERFESASVATEVVGAGAAFVRTADGRVTARELSDGRERWRFEPGTASDGRTVVVTSHQPDLAFDGGDLLVAAGDRLVALDPETGRRRWEYAAGEPLTRFFTVADDAVVLTTETSLQVVDRV